MDSKPKNPDFEKLVNLMPKQGDLGRRMAQQIVDGVVSGRITLDSIRGTVEQERRKSEKIIDIFLSFDVEDPESAVNYLESLIDLKLYDTIRHAYESGDTRVVEQLDLLFNTIASISFGTKDIEKSVEEAYISSFRFDTFSRKIYWGKMKQKAEDAGIQKWVNLFDFIICAENREPEAWKQIHKAQAEMGKLPSPPLDSVHNYEVSVINYTRFYKDNDALAFCYLSAFSGKQLQSAQALSKFRGFYGKPLLASCFHGEPFMNFCFEWADSGFSRIEIGHKLAAALCLTDIPEPVESPWKCWSLVVPSGIFPIHIEVSGITKVKSEIERFWCSGSTIVGIVYQIKGLNVHGLDNIDEKKTIIVADTFEKMDFGDQTETLRTLYNNLVRGVCLCVTDKSEEHKGNWGRPSHGGQKAKKAANYQSFGERYVIGKPVSIDLRDELKTILDNESPSRSSSSPRFQFLVRGHWRNQPYGPGRTQYRQQWIEPFWKGNEETRTLLRTYEIKKD